ncbi:MAG: conjugal transfer protein TraD [Alphaproteobacteria bacterium]|jgi:hypothetical protein|nr:conjugal transfer protein TraD [Alphaproteobacteria bacterium]MBP9777297.1 conjugal transfer protein TraD [Alphaproteobacteria bacterium]
MSTLEIDSHGARRARTRSLIQLSGLIEKSALLETFQITLGLDLQKDVTMKEPIAALFKGLLVLNDLASSDETNLHLWARQGLEILANTKKR